MTVVCQVVSWTGYAQQASRFSPSQSNKRRRNGAPMSLLRARIYCRPTRRVLLKSAAQMPEHDIIQ